jgi:hypothetical protein
MKLRKGWLIAMALMSTPGLSATAQEAPKDWQFEVGESATVAREKWGALTAGENLALGKKVEFFPTPQDALTTDENDPYDLTDGKLSERADDRVWFNKDAVGWYGGTGTAGGVLLVVDLGAPQPVGQIAIRVLGGHEQGSLDLPTAIEFLASNDGENYHTLQKTVRLNEGEKDQSDFVRGFYYPQEGVAYMAPLFCKKPVRARYIAMRVTLQNSLFTDQISITKAADGVDVKSVDAYPKAQVFTDGLVVSPRHSPMTVTTNVATPNWLMVLDNSNLDLKNKENRAAFRMELPKGLRVLPQSELKFKEVAGNANANVYEFPYDGTNRYGAIGPVWIEAEAGAKLPADATVLLTGILQDKDSHSLKFPLKLVQVPEVPKSDALDISLAWNHDAQQQMWPHFLRDFRKMGFNFVSTFPYYYYKDASGQWNEQVQKNLAFLQQARRDGYKIVANESPFHAIWKIVEADRAAGKIDAAEAAALFNQVDGKPGQWMFPLYRGKYYQAEMERVAEGAALVQPDHLYFDIEWFPPVIEESRKDPRMIAAWKASGKEWDDFVTDIGTEIMTTMVTKMRAAVPQRKMLVGLYNSDPQNKIYDAIFQWDKIYPGLIDIAQPSLYVQGRAQVIADRIQFDNKTLGNRQIIPWLSTGTYGEHDPKFVEPMVLEAILNGARGLTYYWFGDFDPMDFYFHSKALKTLAPYEKLLRDGKPISYQGDNPNLHYTAFGSPSGVLLMVANYSSSAQTKVNLPLVLKDAKKAIVVDGAPLKIGKNGVTIDVPPGEFRLVYMSDTK